MAPASFGTLALARRVPLIHRGTPPQQRDFGRSQAISSGSRDTPPRLKATGVHGHCKRTIPQRVCSAHGETALSTSFLGEIYAGGERCRVRGLFGHRRESHLCLHELGHADHADDDYDKHQCDSAELGGCLGWLTAAHQRPPGLNLSRTMLVVAWTGTRTSEPSGATGQVPRTSAVAVSASRRTCPDRC
jgi:hypothetical protein